MSEQADPSAPKDRDASAEATTAAEAQERAVPDFSEPADRECPAG